MVKTTIIDARPSNDAMVKRMARDKVAKVVEGQWATDRYTLIVWIDDFGDGRCNYYRRLRNGTVGRSWSTVTLGDKVTITDGGAMLVR